MSMRAESNYHYLYILPAILTLFFIILLPIAYNIWLSFYEKRVGEEPVFAYLNNYVRLLSSPITMVSLINTFIYAFTSVALKLLIGLGAALLLNTKFRGRSFVRVLSIFPWAVPSYIAAVMFWFNFARDGAFNKVLSLAGIGPIHWLGYDHAMTSVIILNIWHGWPFFMMGLLAGLQAVPQELYEASEIDGARAHQRFFYITLPLLKPVMLTVVLLSLIWTMGEFAQIYLTTAGGPIDRTLTIPVAAYRLAFTGEANISLAAAYSVLMLPLYLLLIFVTLRYMRA
ncbi:MAG: sugar ABC transporter permease [Sulfolobales archaeon]